MEVLIVWAMHPKHHRTMPSSNPGLSVIPKVSSLSKWGRIWQHPVAPLKFLDDSSGRIVFYIQLNLCAGSIAPWPRVLRLLLKISIPAGLNSLGWTLQYHILRL
jgi:hypothetical protein